MTTAPALRSVDSAPVFGDFDVDEDGYAVDDTPKTDFWMVTKVRGDRPGKVSKAKYHLTALAISDAGSALHLLGGRPNDPAAGIRTLRGLEVYFRRVLIDDDGVPEAATAQLVTDDALDLAQRRADGEEVDEDEEDDGPPVIPEDAALDKLKKPALKALAEANGLDGDGTREDLIVGLAAERKLIARRASGELAPINDEDDVLDAELVDTAAQVRLVHPNGTLADDAVFATLDEARTHADEHASSKRKFFSVLVSEVEEVGIPQLYEIYNHIVGKAADRDPKPSSGSSRSARRKTRRERT